MQTIINQHVPEFSVQAFQNGSFKTVSNQDIEGKWAIFFFYPADFTFVCPTELEDLSEKYDELKAMGVEGTETMTQEEYRDAAIAAVRQLSKDVGIPEKNERIREEDLEQLAKDALADACYPGNPREATQEQVIEMFRMLMV